MKICIILISPTNEHEKNSFSTILSPVSVQQTALAAFHLFFMLNGGEQKERKQGTMRIQAGEAGWKPLAPNG